MDEEDNTLQCDYYGCRGRYPDEELGECGDCDRTRLDEVTDADTLQDLYTGMTAEAYRLKRWIEVTIAKLHDSGTIAGQRVCICLVCQSTWISGHREQHTLFCIARRLKDQALKGWSETRDAEGRAVCHRCGGQTNGVSCLDCGTEWS